MKNFFEDFFFIPHGTKVREDKERKDILM